MRLGLAICGGASELWVHSTLEQRQRLQQLFFPDGMVDLSDASYNSVLGLVQRFAPVASMARVPEKTTESLRSSGGA